MTFPLKLNVFLSLRWISGFSLQIVSDEKKCKLFKSSHKAKATQGGWLGVAFEVTTECVTDLDLQSKMIIFESILTTFESSVIFEAVAKIGSSLKPNHYVQFQLAQICETLWKNGAKESKTDRCKNMDHGRWLYYFGIFMLCAVLAIHIRLQSNIAANLLFI